MVRIRVVALFLYFSNASGCENACGCFGCFGSLSGGFWSGADFYCENESGSLICVLSDSSTVLWTANAVLTGCEIFFARLESDCETSR